VPSSTTSERAGCSGRLALLVAGGLALAFAAIALIGAAMQWWREYDTQKRWPRAEAVIEECKLVEHKGIRGSVRNMYGVDCSITFDADGQRVQGGFSSQLFVDPNSAEANAWIAQHPPGSRITVHYDPSWHPSAVPEGPPGIFDTSSPRLFLKTAGIAGIVAVVLLGAAFLLRR
jgi:hypothetical protein